MPYENVKELPQLVRDELPPHAQEIYMDAFNSAWGQYAEPQERRGGRSREETAHAVAWAAVERAYEKDAQGKWVKKPGKSD